MRKCINKINANKMVKKESPLVSIQCLVYNHGPYLRQCLEGFVMQKTNFAFEAIVHDDASTDNSADIIREYAEKYPDIIKPIYETENQYSKKDGSLDRIMNAAIHPDAKYIAMCEGDDYWIDPLKLQKQVNFLENHGEYGMVYTNFNIHYQKAGVTIQSLFTTNPLKFKPKYKNVEEFLLSLGYVCPPSWLWRKNLASFPKIINLDGTFVYFVHFLSITKVHCMMDVTATYRILEESATQSKDYNKLYIRNKNLLETQWKLIDLYNLPSNLKETCLRNYYTRSLFLFLLNKNKDEFHKAKHYVSINKLKYNILALFNNIVGRELFKIIYKLYKLWQDYNLKIKKK